MIWRCAQRAVSSGLPFDLTVQWLANILKDGRCQATGLPFDFNKGGARRPLAPSIDRIDPIKGYVFGNVRVVCWIYNCSKNVYDDETVLRFAKALTHYSLTGETTEWESSPKSSAPHPPP